MPSFDVQIFNCRDQRLVTFSYISSFPAFVCFGIQFTHPRLPDNLSPSPFPASPTPLSSCRRAPGGRREFFPRCPRFQSPTADPSRGGGFWRCATCWICRTPLAHAGPSHPPGAIRALSARCPHTAAFCLV